MGNLHRHNHRWGSAMGLALALLATVPLANIAGTPTAEPISNKFDPLHWLQLQGKTQNPKVHFGKSDAWVAKYQAGPDGVRKVLWKKQLGTSTDDYSRGVATDSSGNVFITGFTDGALEGTFQGALDAWVAKYSSTGNLLWKKQLGTSQLKYSYGIATDSSGNVFITGVTDGALGDTNKGKRDAWVAKYSPDGTQLWIKQLGTSAMDGSLSVAIDSSSNLFITGFTSGVLGGTSKGRSDAWVAKYSPDGTQLWIKQLGSSNYDISWGVATDSSGNVFITGYTNGALGGTNKGSWDAWVAKYSPEGTLKWAKQLGSSKYDYSWGVATDSSGNVFITGITAGALGGTFKGYRDAWVAKYGPAGGLKWKRQLGTSGEDYSSSVATDSSGNVFITGATDGALGSTDKRGPDIWVAKFSPYGKQLWLRQDGTRSGDYARGVAVDSNDYVITTGITYGNFSKD